MTGPDDPLGWPRDERDVRPGGASPRPHHADAAHPAESGPAFLATNAPTTWPRVPAIHLPDRDHVPVHVIVAHVAAYLHGCGFEILDADHVVEASSQRVRVDLVVRDGSREHPVFVFPGVDVHREGTMFDFLNAFLHEAKAFTGRPVYYGLRPLPHTRPPTLADVGEAARRFELLIAEAGEVARLDAGGVADVIRAFRAVARVRVEDGGGSAVTGAAAFLGEWLRRRVGGEWKVREDLARTVLVLRDPGGAIQYELPLFAYAPDAVREGYDGLAELVGQVIADVTQEAATAPTTWSDLPVHPDRYRPLVLAWLLEDPSQGEQTAAVFRACAACGDETGEGCAFTAPAATMDEVFDRVVGLVNEPPPACTCGGEDYREAFAIYRIREDGTSASSGGRLRRGPRRRKQREHPPWSVLVASYFADSHSRISVHRVREDVA